MSISLITRADDLGASHSANIAIAGAATKGDYIKNISCMAVGPWIDEGAELLRGCRGVCLGMHATLNAEWDPFKWEPLSPPEEVPTLVNEQGTYFSVMHPAKASKELLLCRNEQIPAGVIAAGRDLEYRLLLTHQLEEICDESGITRLRYDETEPTGVTFEELKRIIEIARKGNRDG